MGRGSFAVPLASLGERGARLEAGGRNFESRQPFTIPFATRSTPPELWDQPRFYTANATISMIWTVSFVATAAVLATVLATAAQPVW